MDSTYSDQLYEGVHSHTHRSRTNSGVSTTEALFHSLKLAESSADTFDPTPYNSSSPQSSHGLASPAYISPAPPTSATFLPTINSQSQSNLPRIPDSVLNASWFDTQEPSTQGTPIVRISPAITYSELTRSTSQLPNTRTASMSTVALQYDPTFNMAGRSPYGWPVVECNNMLGHELGSYTSDVSLTPPTHSRLVTGSPPKMLTAEQREAKRQSDQARHDHKIAQRQRRTGSGSSYVSSPPLTMAELTTGVTALPIYSTAPSEISLLTEPASSLAPHPYLTTYSPPMENQFPSQYPPQSYMYSPNYSTTTAQSLPPQYGRPTMGDPNMMYQPVPSSMTTGGAESQGSVRVVQSRPKPQCWEHGCNGRQFSTFSNLLRHQREKSGQATKATCPNCGAEFTRTTARNGHLMHDKCKGKRNSTSGSVSGSGNRSD